MTKASNNEFPSILFAEEDPPSAPSTGFRRLFLNASNVNVIGSNSSVRALAWSDAAAAGSVATDAIWDAAGDLAQGTGANTAAKLASGADGTVLTGAGVGSAVAWEYPPGYEVNYVEITSPVNVTATVEASGDTIVTASAISFDGSTTVMIEFFSPHVDPSTAAANRYVGVLLFDGSTSLGYWTIVGSPAAGAMYAPVTLRRRITPSNASHTYSVRAIVNAGTGVVGAGAAGAGNDSPAYIRITRV